MRFDNQKSISYAADAPSFSAVILPGVNVWTATLTYKAGWKAGPPSVTARDQNALLSALQKQDSAVKFYKRDSAAGTLSAKDAAILARLRDDKNTSDIQYRSACRNFGVKPEVRNINTVQAASTANLPQGAPSLRASAEAWSAFETAHGELFQPPYGLLNLRAIEQYFADEKVQWTADTLATCYKELKAANCFRDARTLTRGMHGDLHVVQPYSHERILQLRNQQAVDVATAPPAHLNDVDREVWSAVRAKYPQLSINSAGFKKCCADTVLLWATDYAKEQQPELAAANKRGELRKAVDAVLMQWTRNPNLGQGQKTIKDSRIWLG